MNTINLLEKFAYLPDVLIHKIINYSDVISYRNGKYINRINKQDKRYNLLKSLTKPIYIGTNKILLRLMSHNLCGYFIEYKIKQDIIIINTRFFYREMDGFDRYYNIKSDDTYIVNKNNTLNKFYFIN